MDKGNDYFCSSYSRRKTGLLKKQVYKEVYNECTRKVDLMSSLTVV